MESFPSHGPFKDVRPQATLNKAIPMLFITGDVQVINVCVLTWRVGTRPFGVASGRVEMEETRWNSTGNTVDVGNRFTLTGTWDDMVLSLDEFDGSSNLPT